MMDDPPPQQNLGWRALPASARMYVAGVISCGAWVLLTLWPRAYPRPLTFAALSLAACFTSAWKVNLPIPLTSGSTLSVAYAANLISLLLLGPRHAVVVAAAGTWVQCTFRPRQRYPLYRTVFSVAAVVITMAVTGFVYLRLGGQLQQGEFRPSLRPLVGAIATCFLMNTGLIAGAIALSTRQRVWRIWHEDFVLGAATFMVAGMAGAVAAVVLQRGEFWKAVLMVAPIYVTYRTYQLFVGRIEDQKRHLEEVRRLHEEAVAARASAEQANQVKDQFLAMLSHELRTPLNAILGWASMLRRGDLDGQRLDRASRGIYDSAVRQSQLIEELLDVARIMSGKLRLDPAPVDFAAIIRSAVEVVQPNAEDKRISIDVDTALASGAVDGDGARLQQIVWNLLSNAAKFTPEGGTIRVRVRDVARFVELDVSDNGPGIAPEFLPFVFEPFRQADGSTTRRHGGLGLGLSIVRHLVDAHGGTVTAHNNMKGHGATFRVRLPVFAPVRPEHVVGVEGRAPEVFAPSMPATLLDGVSVLVVDDDDESRHVVAAHLEQRHAMVLTATTAAEAFDLLQRRHVDVLLADVAMPGEDGYSLIRRVRTAASMASIPAAALTAFAREQDREQALEAGFQFHLTKPIDPESLVAAVATLSKTHSLNRC